MDVDEKLNAVKKAYAEIILNISKEAAARVMVSEKKATRYQHELKMAKEEAIRMLVRLKEMMESKNIASESASLNQQKKIEEVEAQLQEAEDIVKDLREELRETQAELEKIKIQYIQPANRSGNFPSNEIPIENGNHSYLSNTSLVLASQDELTVPSPVTTTYQSMISESHQYSNNVVCMHGSYTGNRDMPSITLGGTQAELEKVKTQNIQPANKPGNFLSNEIPIENGNHSYMSDTSPALASQDELDISSPITTTYQSMGSESHKYCNKAICMRGPYTGNRDLPSIILRGKRPGLYRNVFTHRIRACERNQLCFPERTDNVKEGKEETGTIDDKGTGKSLDSEAKSTSLIEKEQFFGKEADVFESQMQKKRRTVSLGNYISPLTENNILSNISARGDPTPVNENANLSDNTEFSGKESLVEDDVVEVLKHEESNKIMVPTTVDGNVETSLSLDHKKDVENINSSEGIVSRNVETSLSVDHKKDVENINSSEGIVRTEPVREKDFRFTFQRKRKKEALSSSADVIKTKSGDEMNSSDQKLESSRDQQRLAQVARQLISLSGKKWWQEDMLQI